MKKINKKELKKIKGGSSRKVATGGVSSNVKHNSHLVDSNIPGSFQK